MGYLDLYQIHVRLAGMQHVHSARLRRNTHGMSRVTKSQAQRWKDGEEEDLGAAEVVNVREDWEERHKRRGWVGH